MKKNRSSLGQLEGNPKNPRRITDKKLDMLKKALSEFGDLSGIVFNRKSGQLVGGHQRVKVLSPDSKIIIRKNYEKPTRTGTVAEGFVEIDGEEFAYREVEWTDAKEKAANIAANKGAGDWDFSQLSEWMLELDFGLCAAHREKKCAVKECNRRTLVRFCSEHHNAAKRAEFNRPPEDDLESL